MPRLNRDLNLSPGRKPLSRCLSFSDSPSSALASTSQMRGRFRILNSIPESSEEQEAEATRPRSTGPLWQGISGTSYAAPASALVTTTWPAIAPPAAAVATTGRAFVPPATPAATTWPTVAPPAAPSLSQQSQETARMLEYQRQRQAALEQQARAAAAARPRPRLLRLYTAGRDPAGYDTKWEELHPASQGVLLRIESRMREYKYQSEQLDQCVQLHNPSLYNKSFELDAIQTTQEVGSTSTILGREKVTIESLTHAVQEIMLNTDVALRSYSMLKPAHTEFNHRMITVPTIHCYSAAPRRPSPFLQITVARFEERLGECCKWIHELEQLVQVKDDKTFQESVECLSKVMSNVHDYFIHVASKVEDIHQYLETMKIRYLNDRRHRGDWNDPFFEADRRESAKKEATDRIIHPTLHVSPPGQPTTLVAAPFIACQLQQTSFPAVAASPRSCPTLPPPSVLHPPNTQTSPGPLIQPIS